MMFTWRIWRQRHPSQEFLPTRKLSSTFSLLCLTFACWTFIPPFFRNGCHSSESTRNSIRSSLLCLSSSLSSQQPSTLNSRRKSADRSGSWLERWPWRLGSFLPDRHISCGCPTIFGCYHSVSQFSDSQQVLISFLSSHWWWRRSNQIS